MIYKCGFICPNKGNFQFSWDQTKGSFVYKLGGISLLDFGLPENKVFLLTIKRILIIHGNQF